MNLQEESLRLEQVMDNAYKEWMEQFRSVEAAIKELSASIEATEKTDLSENATYTILRDDRDMKIQSKAILTEKIEAYTEKNSDYVPTGVIKLGSTFILEPISLNGEAISTKFPPFKLVPDLLSSGTQGLLSVESKCGSTCIGLRAGDTFEVQAQIGLLKYLVKEVY